MSSTTPQFRWVMIMLSAAALVSVGSVADYNEDKKAAIAAKFATELGVDLSRIQARCIFAHAISDSAHWDDGPLLPVVEAHTHKVSRLRFACLGHHRARLGADHRARA